MVRMALGVGRSSSVKIVVVGRAAGCRIGGFGLHASGAASVIPMSMKASSDFKSQSPMRGRQYEAVQSRKQHTRRTQLFTILDMN